MIAIGTKVQVKNMNSTNVGEGEVTKVSATGKRVSVRMVGRPTYVRSFYRDDRQGCEADPDDRRYIDSPGSGLFGHMLNDHFYHHVQAENSTPSMTDGCGMIASDVPASEDLGDDPLGDWHGRNE